MKSLHAREVGQGAYTDMCVLYTRYKVTGDEKKVKLGREIARWGHEDTNLSRVASGDFTHDLTSEQRA